jgi:beta-galactosidase
VKVLARYASGEQVGRPAITHRPVGDGSATYVSTRLGPAGLAPVVEELAGVAGLHSDLPRPARGRVELAVRRNDTEEFWFLINLTAESVEVSGIEGEVLVGTIPLAPRGVTVLRRPAS